MCTVPATHPCSPQAWNDRNVLPTWNNTCRVQYSVTVCTVPVQVALTHGQDMLLRRWLRMTCSNCTNCQKCSEEVKLAWLPYPVSLGNLNFLLSFLLGKGSWSTCHGCIFYYIWFSNCWWPIGIWKGILTKCRQHNHMWDYIVNIGRRATSIFKHRAISCCYRWMHSASVCCCFRPCQANVYISIATWMMYSP